MYIVAELQLKPSFSQMILSWEYSTMKITTFNPQIITKDAEAVAKLFEELGFERRHNPKGIGELDVILRYGSGFSGAEGRGIVADGAPYDAQRPACSSPA